VLLLLAVLVVYCASLTSQLSGTRRSLSISDLALASSSR
jgi:hypothetical protein